MSRPDGKLHIYSEKVDVPNNHLSIEVRQETDPFVLEVEHFLDYVQKDAPCICDGVSERESLAVIVGAFESIKTGKKVNLRTKNDVK